MIIQKIEVYISEIMKKDNSVYNVKIAIKIVNMTVIAMSRIMEEMIIQFM